MGNISNNIQKSESCSYKFKMYLRLKNMELRNLGYLFPWKKGSFNVFFHSIDSTQNIFSLPIFPSLEREYYILFLSLKNVFL